MSAIKVKSRNVGATAEIERVGRPFVSSFTGGNVDFVMSASSDGFNALDLLFASLASCLAVSLRVAISDAGLLSGFVGAKVSVSGAKTQTAPMRIECFIVDVKIDGDLTDEQRSNLIHHAEEICTVSNTLKATNQVAIKLV